MPLQRKNVKRFKPVHIDSWLLVKKDANRFKPVYIITWLLLKKNVSHFKPVHAVSWLFANKTNHKPVQTGSDRLKDSSPRK